MLFFVKFCFLADSFLLQSLFRLLIQLNSSTFMRHFLVGLRDVNSSLFARRISVRFYLTHVAPAVTSALHLITAYIAAWGAQSFVLLPYAISKRLASLYDIVGAACKHPFTAGFMTPVTFHLDLVNNTLRLYWILVAIYFDLLDWWYMLWSKLNDVVVDATTRFSCISIDNLTNIKLICWVKDSKELPNSTCYNWLFK